MISVLSRLETYNKTYLNISILKLVRRTVNAVTIMDLTSVTKMDVILDSTSIMTPSCVTVSVLMNVMCRRIINNVTFKPMFYNVYISRMVSI